MAAKSKRKNKKQAGSIKTNKAEGKKKFLKKRNSNPIYYLAVAITTAIILMVILLMFRSPLHARDSRITKVNNTAVERLVLIGTDLVSCQLDCTLNDGRYHPECVGYNGCMEQEHFKDPYFCQEDSDCAVNYYCCSFRCKGDGCADAPFCEVKNKDFIEAHKFSCQSLGCESMFICKEPSRIFCNKGKCDIRAN